MPLILAIEPDRRQASQLKKLVRSVGAELVLADTTERALDTIGNRIPDLVLVPALLSPQDDAALATALRVIATAAHVQTLTIPVFAAPTARPRNKGGVLAKLMGDRPQAAAPEGCNPGLFAEQIASYLAEAEAARAARAPDPDEYEPPVVARVAELIAPAPSFDVEPWLETTADEVASVPTEYEAVTAESERAVDAVEPEPEPVVRPFEPKPLHIVHAAPELIQDADAEWQPVVESEPERLHVTPDAPSDAHVVPEFDPSDIDLGAFIAELEEQRRAARVEGPDPAEERAAVASAALEEESEPAPDANAEFEVWMTSLLAPPRAWPKLEGAAAEPLTVAPEARVEQPEATVVAEIEPAASDWIEMLEALRRDIDRLRVERTEVSLPAAAPVAAAPVAAAPVAAASQADAPPAPPRRKKRKKQAPRPVQDEWGFFDPEQCGFTALLAKLDEISDSNDDSGERSP